MNKSDLFEGYGVEIELLTEDDFLKVRETLTRIGVESRINRTIYQSCHVLHKKGRYSIFHFKELFLLDGKHSDLSVNDLERRNTIVRLLSQWNLARVLNPIGFQELEFAPMSQIKVIPHRHKGEWNLQAKYTIGKK